MSSHHSRQGWRSISPRYRALLLPRLPMPCVECGKPVFPDPPGHVGPTTWHVGHITPASKGGRPTPDNVGPAHASCNMRNGGTLGANTANRRRRRDDERGLRRWT